MSMETLKPTTKATTPSLDISPFDSRDNADVVLRTNDGIEFAVRRMILSDASPIFHTTFQLPQPNDANSMPIIDVDDAGRDLLQLLRWCHPRCKPSFKQTDILLALRLANKYDMAGVVETLREVLTSKASMLSREPLKAYAISVELGLQTHAQLAIKECLRHTLDELKYVSELGRLNGAAVFHIFQQYLKCREAARAAALAFGLETCRKYIWGKCTGRHRNDRFNGKRVAKYWGQYVQALAEALYRRPRMTHEQLLQTFVDCNAADESLSCIGCRSVIKNDVNAFLREFALYIDRVIDKELFPTGRRVEARS